MTAFSSCSLLYFTLIFPEYQNVLKCSSKCRIGFLKSRIKDHKILKKTCSIYDTVEITPTDVYMQPSTYISLIV